jgi:hypothetical protein
MGLGLTKAQSDRQALATLDPALRERAFRRGIRITKGFNWGLTIDFQSGDREMSFCALTAFVESPLRVFLAVGGFVLGVLSVVVVGLSSGWGVAPYSIWLVSGAAMAGFGWLISLPLEGVTRKQLSDLIDIITQRLKGNS